MSITFFFLQQPACLQCQNALWVFSKHPAGEVIYIYMMIEMIDENTKYKIQNTFSGVVSNQGLDSPRQGHHEIVQVV